MSIEIDRYRAIEIKLNIKCKDRLELSKFKEENKIPCTIEVLEVIKPGLYEVLITTHPHSIKKFMKKIKKLIKEK